jgi:hypothetical protein
MNTAGLPVAEKRAVLSNYRAGQPSRTGQLYNWYGTNPNSVVAQIERVNMQFTGEFMIKNCPFASAYSEVRKMYCTPLKWIPNTGDAALNNELSSYLQTQWEDAGDNCSIFDAISRTFDVEMPARGDAGMILFRDAEAGRLRYLEFSADQLGELWSFNVPFGDPIDGTTYFAGIYTRNTNGQVVAYKIYERGFNQIYTNPQIYAACDVIFVKTGPFRGIRGITDFHAAIQSVEKGDRFLQNAMDAATKQASIASVIRNERGAPDEGTYDTDTAYDGTLTYVQRAMDGAVTEYQYKGDEMVMNQVAMPGQEVLDGYDKALEQGCLALGFPFSFIINATKVGGAPSRLEIEKATKKIDALIRYRIPFLNRIARTEILDAMSRGKFPKSANLLNGHWQFPKSPTADAFRDSASDIDALRYGLSSPQRICAQYNENFDDVIREKADSVLRANQELARINAELAPLNLKAGISDIMASSENPAQTAQAEQVDTQTDKGIPPEKKAVAAEFDESKHPRADDGKFGSGGAKSTKDDKHEDPNASNPKNTSSGYSESSRTVRSAVDKSFGDRSGISPESAASLMKGRVKSEMMDWIDANIAGDPGSEAGEILRSSLKRIAPYKEDTVFRGLEFDSPEQRDLFVKSIGDNYTPKGVIESASKSESAAKLFGQKNGVILIYDSDSDGLVDLQPISESLTDITAGENEVAVIGGSKWNPSETFEEDGRIYVRLNRTSDAIP